MVAEDHVQKYPTRAEIMEEFIRLKDIGFPIITITLVGYLKGMITVICMGRLGRLELAGGALAVGFTNITGYSVLSGLALGMDPVCSQALGSRNFQLATLTLYRTIFILLCASLPIAVLWANLKTLMLILHQEPEITRVAGLYCLFSLPDLLATSFLHPIRVYLRNRGTQRPLVCCTSLAVLLHLPLTYLLAFAFRLGVPGVAIASFCTNFNTLIFLLGYMLYTQSTKEALSTPLAPLSPPVPSNLLGEDCWVLLRLSLPSCVSVCLEWWWYEFMTLLAGYLHNPRVTLATSAIVIQTTSLMYTLPMALSASVSARVGNELGAGRPFKARVSALVAMSLALLVSVFGLLLTTIGREAWGRVFTEDDEVLKLTMAVLPIIGLCEVANCPQTTGCGVLRGSARPTTGASINFYSFYLVGAPIAILLAFTLRLGFVGLSYGLLAAQIACALSILMVIIKTDWDRESLKAKDLVGRGACGDEGEAAKSGEDVKFLKEASVET